MIRPAWALGLALLSGCAVDEAPPAMPEMPPARPTTTAQATAFPPARPKKPLSSVLVARDFARYLAVEPPKTLDAMLHALRPKGVAHRVVAWGLDRHIRQTRPALGRRQAMLRIVTPLSGPELEAALTERLRATGWLMADQAWASEIVHAQRGRLLIKVKVPAERATRVEFTLRGPEATVALDAPEALVTRPAWLGAGWPARPTGYQVGHWHDRPPHSGPTDVQLLSVLLPQRSAQQPIEARLRAGGFTRNPDGVWMRQGDTVAFAERKNSLLVVVQHRFKRALPVLPPLPGARTAPSAPAVSGSSAPPG